MEIISKYVILGLATVGSMFSYPVDELPRQAGFSAIEVREVLDDEGLTRANPAKANRGKHKGWTRGKHKGWNRGKRKGWVRGKGKAKGRRR